MPRTPDAANAYYREATERSRKKARAVGRPEADYADAAISAAVYVLAKRIEAEKGDTALLGWIIPVASEILKSHPGKDFDPGPCDRKIIYRAGKRPVSMKKRFLNIARSIPLPGTGHREMDNG